MFKSQNFVELSALYDRVLSDIAEWFLNEIKLRPIDDQLDSDGVQHNALMNFITFDLHALVTQQGFVHMQKILQAEGTDQTVMIRLKDLVSTLYIKYGNKNIDKLRARTYQAIDAMYGLNFKSEDMDVNNTFWLCPFFKHIYTRVSSNA